MILRDDEPLCHGCVYDKEGPLFRKKCDVCYSYDKYITTGKYNLIKKQKDLSKKLKNAS